MSRRTSRSSGEDALRNFSDVGGRDGISDLNGEVGLLAGNDPKI